MANERIIMTTIEGRPCWVDGRRAIFHRWSDSARPVKDTSTLLTDENAQFQKWSVHAIVEYEDGTVEREWPNKIRFADSREYFDTLAWGPCPEDTDDKLLAAAQESLAEIAAEQPTVEIEINRWCDTCAHENPVLWADHCGVNKYDCPNCQAPGCICKTCTDSNKWEPKEGTA